MESDCSSFTSYFINQKEAQKNTCIMSYFKFFNHRRYYTISCTHNYNLFCINILSTQVHCNQFEKRL